MAGKVINQCLTEILKHETDTGYKKHRAWGREHRVKTRYWILEAGCKVQDRKLLRAEGKEYRVDS